MIAKEIRRGDPLICIMLRINDRLEDFQYLTSKENTCGMLIVITQAFTKFEEISFRLPLLLHKNNIKLEKF